MILSTGRSNIQEIKEAIKCVRNKKSNLSILHCVSSYPAKFTDLNLRAIQTLKKKFNLKIGYSDHSLGIEASLAAVAMGAKIIEKHITLNKNQYGPDHKASIEPNEFKNMVKCIRNIERALGDGKKIAKKSELQGKIYVRRSLTARTNIKKGSKITIKNISIKRPATGIQPKYLKKIIGYKLLKDVNEDDQIKWEYLKKK